MITFRQFLLEIGNTKASNVEVIKNDDGSKLIYFVANKIQYVCKMSYFYLYKFEEPKLKNIKDKIVLNIEFGLVDYYTGNMITSKLNTNNSSSIKIFSIIRNLIIDEVQDNSAIAFIMFCAKKELPDIKRNNIEIEKIFNARRNLYTTLSTVTAKKFNYTSNIFFRDDFEIYLLHDNNLKISKKEMQVIKNYIYEKEQENYKLSFYKK